MNDEQKLFEKYDLVDVDETFPIPDLPEEGLILLFGPSGSGKSTILNTMFDDPNLTFGDKPIWEEFSSVERAEELLIACGLRSIPTWKRPYNQLSNGEQHRVHCARLLDIGCEFIDEFSSVVDRDTAKSLAVAIAKFYKNSNMKRLVIATCHSDIMEWLTPDHAYDTGNWSWIPKECLRQSRPDITIELEPCNGKEVWKVFKKHHYLSHKFNTAANCWLATYNNIPVGFTSILTMPSGTLKNAWREHRTVVVPEFQGLGIGNAISNTIGQHLIENGYRYYSKTAHPAMGEHRQNSPKWRATGKNKIPRVDYSKDRPDKKRFLCYIHTNRVCYSHEYIGSEE